MKQTLEEAARSEREKIILELHDDYSIHKDPEHYIISSGVIQKYAVPIFKAGAEWQAKQSPWISVNERLPEENTSVFFAVVWKDIHKGYFVGVYYGSGYWGSEYRIFLPNSLISKVTHWMPIPSFDEILEANKDVLERIKEKGD